MVIADKVLRDGSCDFPIPATLDKISLVISLWWFIAKNLKKLGQHVNMLQMSLQAFYLPSKRGSDGTGSFFEMVVPR